MTTQARVGWWLYFWVLILINVASIFLDPPDLEGWALLLFSGVAIAGLWGYLRNRAIGHHLFWSAFFCASVPVIAYYLIRPSFLDSEWRGLVLSGALIGLVLSIPLLLALWRYAFRSPDIWRTARAA